MKQAFAAGNASRDKQFAGRVRLDNNRNLMLLDIDSPQAFAENLHEWRLQRNCSLTPRQTALAFGLLCLLSLALAVFWTLHGAWYVLAFSVLEISAAGAAYLHYSRHATDGEHVRLANDCLSIARTVGGKESCIRLHPAYARVMEPAGRHGLVHIESKNLRVEVGAFIPVEKRLRFAHELRQRLARRASFRTPDG